MGRLAELPLAEYLAVSENSVSGLVWIKHPGGRHAKVGGAALCGVNSTGYYNGKLKGVSLLAHRVVYYLVHGTEPEVVDHVDRDPMNNHPDNLRAATKQQNAFNSIGHADNLTGYKGVTRAGKKYQAVLCFRGVNRYLGRFPTAAEAHAAYLQAAMEVHGEFFNSGN